MKSDHSIRKSMSAEMGYIRKKLLQNIRKEHTKGLEGITSPPQFPPKTHSGW